MRTLKKNYWIKSWNRPLRRNINSNKRELRQFFLFVIHTTLKIYEEVWHKHNLMISFSVVYGHPVKYSYEIPHEYLSGLGNGNFLSRICCDIFGKLYFWKSYFFTLFQSKCFQSNIRVTFSEQLFLQSSCFFLRSSFFRTVTFSQHFFFRIVTFSERNFHRATTSWE